MLPPVSPRAHLAVPLIAVPLWTAAYAAFSPPAIPCQPPGRNEAVFFVANDKAEIERPLGAASYSSPARRHTCISASPVSRAASSGAKALRRALNGSGVTGPR